MSCYFVAQIHIKDWITYQKYLNGFDVIFKNYKGTVVSVDDDPVKLEGDWPYTRTVLIYFPNETEAKKWYESVEYQQLAEYRRKASQANIVLVKGR